MTRIGISGDDEDIDDEVRGYHNNGDDKYDADHGSNMIMILITTLTKATTKQSSNSNRREDFSITYG